MSEFQVLLIKGTVAVISIDLPSELGTFKRCISGLMLDPLFFLISRLNNACSPIVINLHINKPIGIKDIPFYLI